MPRGARRQAPPLATVLGLMGSCKAVPWQKLRRPARDAALPGGAGPLLKCAAIDHRRKSSAAACVLTSSTCVDGQTGGSPLWRCTAKY